VASQFGASGACCRRRGSGKEQRYRGSGVPGDVNGVRPDLIQHALVADQLMRVDGEGASALNVTAPSMSRVSAVSPPNGKRAEALCPWRAAPDWLLDLRAEPVTEPR